MFCLCHCATSRPATCRVRATHTSPCRPHIAVGEARQLGEPSLKLVGPSSSIVAILEFELSVRSKLARKLHGLASSHPRFSQVLSPERPRHDLKRPWDAVTKRAGLTGVRL